MRRMYFALLVCLITVATAAAQVTVSGTVLDDYGHGLRGAAISVDKKPASVFSDDAGQFEISAPKGSLLSFSHPDYTTNEIRVTDTMPILVMKLMRGYINTRDTVNVLYETKTSDRILGSVSTIYTNQLTTTPAPLYAYAFAGRLPGLYTQQSRGWTNTNTTATATSDPVFGTFTNASTVGLKGPNDNTEINLLLRGQAPITIVDGVQRDIYTIDPENIESVSVLKDALSTILLGQRSSRGVILVTTKKPVMGTPHVSFTAQAGIQTPLNLPDAVPAYQYAYLYNEALANQGAQPAYTSADFEAYRNHADPYGHPDVDWFNTILKKNSAISRYSLNVNGGGRTARYTMGVSFFDQEGLLRGSNTDYETQANIKRYTINTGIDVDVTSAFNTKMQIFARIQDGNQPGGGLNNIISQMYSTSNNAYAVFNPDGSFGGAQTYPRNLLSMVTNSGYIQDYTRDIMANLELNYKFDKFIKGLWARGQTNLSVYASNSVDRSLQVPSFKLNISPLTGDSSYNRFGASVDQSNAFALTYSAQYWYVQGALGYTRQFQKHNVSAKVFYDRYQSIFNFDLPEVNQNIAASVSYNYGEKYFAEGTLNYSGNDRYPPGNQFGWFYATGLGYNIAAEDFIKNNSNLGWINKLKLRATYGRTGNANIGYYAWRESYQLDNLGGGYAYGINRTPYSAITQNTLANPDATWEKANKLNAGVDIALFKNHVSFTADYYINRYYDLMQVRGKATSIIGITYPAENLGINRYSGLELSASYQSHVGSLNYFITGNASFEKSKVIYSDEIERDYAWNRRTGQPVGMTFGYIADGLIQTQKEAESSPHIAGYTLQPGDIKYRDLNGDGTINDFDQTAIGSAKPLLYYGVNAGLSFKGLDVSVLLQGVENRKIVIGEYSFGNGSSQAYNYAIGRWTPETGTSATYPRLTPGINASNDIFILSRVSTFWMHSGDYFRIKNAEIGYTIPYRWTNPIKISAIRVFANGLNLFTRADFTRADPEVSGQVYPIQRVINFGINVKF